jgi:hypothetical protein
MSSLPPPPPPRRSKPGVVPVREPSETSTVSRVSAPSERVSAPSERVSAPPRAPTSTPPRPSADSAQPPAAYDVGDFAHSAHLDAQGNILAGNGQLEELASLAAYACRIGSLVGRWLSFGEVTGMEVTLANGVIMLHRDGHGEIVCVKPRAHLNLVELRAQLNL